AEDGIRGFHVTGVQTCAPSDLARLAVRSELRPVLRHRRVQVQRAALGQHVRRGRGRTLGRRVDQLQRVPRPRTTGFGVGDAAPQVHHRPAVPVYAHRCADVAVPGEVRRERFTHRFESGCHLTVDRRHAVHPGSSAALPGEVGSPWCPDDGCQTTTGSSCRRSRNSRTEGTYMCGSSRAENSFRRSRARTELTLSSRSPTPWFAASSAPSRSPPASRASSRRLDRTALSRGAALATEVSRELVARSTCPERNRTLPSVDLNCPSPNQSSQSGFSSAASRSQREAARFSAVPALWW